MPSTTQRVDNPTTPPCNNTATLGDSPTGFAACSFVPTVRTSSMRAVASGWRCVVINSRITSAVFLAHAYEPCTCLCWCECVQTGLAVSRVCVLCRGRWSKEKRTGQCNDCVVRSRTDHTHRRRSCVQYSSTRLLRFMVLLLPALLLLWCCQTRVLPISSSEAQASNTLRRRRVERQALLPAVRECFGDRLALWGTPAVADWLMEIKSGCRCL